MCVVDGDSHTHLTGEEWDVITKFHVMEFYVATEWCVCNTMKILCHKGEKQFAKWYIGNNPKFIVKKFPSTYTDEKDWKEGNQLISLSCGTMGSDFLMYFPKCFSGVDFYSDFVKMSFQWA